MTQTDARTTALSHKMQALQGGTESSFVRMLRLAAQIPDVISLGRGDPDLPTPDHIVQAAVQALQTRHVNYTAPIGLLALRQAIARKLLRENDVAYDPETEIVVTTGAQEAMSVIMQSLLDPGDEVILPDPYYTAYEMAIGLAGGKITRVPAREETEFEVQAADIEAAITPRSRLLILVSPNNPTGAVISQPTLEQIADLAARHDLIVVSDELYEKVIFDGVQAPSIVDLPGMRERTLIVNGFSKTYCMTGFRVGYLVGPEHLVLPMHETHHTLTICAPTMSQHAALAALNGSQECVEEIVGVFAQRRQALLESLAAADIPHARPAGAFFAFPSIRATGMSSADFAVRVLQEAGVLVFPGTQYGPAGEGYLRVSYLAEIPRIREAVARLAEVYHAAVRDRTG